MADVIMPHTWDALYAHYAARDYSPAYLYAKLSRLLLCSPLTVKVELLAAADRADARRAACLAEAVAVCEQCAMAEQEVPRDRWTEIALGVHRSQRPCP